MSLGIGQSVTTLNASAGFKYEISRIGSYYHVKQKDTVNIKSYDSFYTALVSEAYNGLSTSKVESVFLDGDMELDNTIPLPNFSNTFFNGRIKAVTGLAKDMFTNVAPASYFKDIALIGLGHAVIDGNGTGVRGIELTAGDVIPTSRIFGMPDGFLGMNFSVYDTTDDGIYINGGGFSSVNWLKNCSVMSGYGHGVYLLSNADCSIIGGHYDTYGGATKFAVYINNCGYITVKNLDYVNNGCKIDGSYEIEFNSKLVDVGVDMAGLSIVNSYRLKVHDTTFHTTSAVTDDTYNHIISSGASGMTYSQFSNIFGVSTAAHRMKYVIYEGANSDNNQYVNIQDIGNSTGALYLVGATSKGQHQNIIGTVTEA